MGSLGPNTVVPLLVTKSQARSSSAASLQNVLSFQPASCVSPGLWKVIFWSQIVRSLWSFPGAWLVWFGFCVQPAYRHLRETAGLHCDPCTCSWEQPRQGCLSCVYMQPSGSGRQLSQCGQQTVLVFHLKIHFFFISILISCVCCCVISMWLCIL